MSQIYKDTNSTPSADVEFLSGQTGTNPVGPDGSHNIDIFSEETTDNNLAGINTRGAAASNTIWVQLTNRATGALSTNDATPTTIITFPLEASNFVYSVKGDILAHNTTDNDGAVYYFELAVKTDGATATLIGIPDFSTKFEEVTLVDADVSAAVSGNNLLIQVTGVAAKTISWLAQFEYKRVV